jgi:hypothetical protein
MEDALRSDGNVSDEQNQQLIRLRSLIELRDAIEPPVRKRWPVAVVLVGTLVLVSALFFARVSTTAIEMDLKLTEVSFLMPTEQRLTQKEGIDVLEIGVSGLESGSIPRNSDREEQVVVAPDEKGLGLRLVASTEGEQKGSLNLATIIAPPQTRVRMQSSTSSEHRIRMLMLGTNPELRIEADGSVLLGQANGPAQDIKVDQQAFVLKGGKNEVDIDFAYTDVRQNMFSSPLSIADLSLLQVDTIQNDEKTVARRESTILSGTLIFESLNGREQKLRPRETITLTQAEGQIRSLNIRDDGIDLKFVGRVRDIRTGADSNSRSLMPTLLEWLKAHHSLSLLWGSVFYVFGLIIGVLRWWGKPLRTS